ncbi:ferritin family protein [Candidatus Riflebacteria bacterium]
MQDKKAIEILKEAILLEHRGFSFYDNIATNTKSEAVKKVFKMMALEEVSHIKFLRRHLKNYEKLQTFLSREEQNYPAPEVTEILTDEIKKEITAASYEAAAITAAIELEDKAIKVYADRAGEATDPNEKALYEWLVEWEKGHYKMLVDLHNELTKQIWDDNNFWYNDPSQLGPGLDI